jgi:hypothetical protein
MEDAFTDLVDRAHGGHAEQHALLVVVVEQRTGRADEHLQAVVDGLGVVVGPPPPGQPLQQLLLGNLQVDGRVQRRAQLSQVLIQRPGLGDAAGEAVQQEPWAQSGWVSRSSIIATTTWSGTSSPESR